MPGVPPNALGKLKGMLKGMLKGGSKKKQSGQDQQGNASSSTAPPLTQSSKPAASAPVSAPDTSKTLPPTSAPGAATHTQPTNAIAGTALGGAAAGAGVGGLAASKAQPSALGTNDGTSDERPQVSPFEPATGIANDAERSEPVSAIEQDEKPLPPPKNDTVAEEVRDVQPAAPPASQASPVAHQTQTAQRLNPALVSTDDENSKPNGIVPVSSETQPALTESSPQAAAAKPDVLDEKMPVMAEEASEIKPVAAKPGMSATSGPLEDFPEGGAEKDETLR